MASLGPNWKFWWTILVWSSWHVESNHDLAIMCRMYDLQKHTWAKKSDPIQPDFGLWQHRSNKNMPLDSGWGGMLSLLLSHTSMAVGIYLTHGYTKENLLLPFLLTMLYKVYHNGFSPWKFSMSADAITLFLQVGWGSSYTAFEWVGP